MVKNTLSDLLSLGFNFYQNYKRWIYVALIISAIGSGFYYVKSKYDNYQELKIDNAYLAKNVANLEDKVKVVELIRITQVERLNRQITELRKDYEDQIKYEEDFKKRVNIKSTNKKFLDVFNVIKREDKLKYGETK